MFILDHSYGLHVGSRVCTVHCGISRFVANCNHGGLRTDHRIRYADEI